MTTIATAEALSRTAQWKAVCSDVACMRCTRDFVLRVQEESWIDRWLGRLKFQSFRCQVCDARFRTRRAAPLQAGSVGRRQYIRLPVELPALLCFHDETVSTAVVKDLSIGGCEVVSERLLEAGETLTIRLSGLLSAGEIAAEALVVHTAHSLMAGLRFIRLSELHREEIGRSLYITWKSVTSVRHET